MQKHSKQRKSRGQSLAEYGLCLALVAVVCITALNSLGENLSDKIDCIATTVGIGSNGGQNGSC